MGSCKIPHCLQGREMQSSAVVGLKYMEGNRNRCGIIPKRKFGGCRNHSDHCSLAIFVSNFYKSQRGSVTTDYLQQNVILQILIIPPGCFIKGLCLVYVLSITYESLRYLQQASPRKGLPVRRSRRKEKV